MTEAQLNRFFSFAGRQTVLVIGDIMLDRYVWGTVERISPEAPVPVLHLSHSESRLGGAGNVAKNLAALGATPVLCSVISNDKAGDRILKLLRTHALSDTGIFVRSHGVTTVKTRVIGQNQHLLRIDEEEVRHLNRNEEKQFLHTIDSILHEHAPSLIIFQDYNKGCLTPSLIRHILAFARKNNIVVAVDPKEDHFFAFQGVDIFKPNLKEIHTAVPFRVEAEIDVLRKASTYLREKTGCKLVCITLSDKGIFLDDGAEYRIMPTNSRNIVDVCGAGDAVVSVVALARLADLELSVIGRLANLAGGIVCEQVGVVPVERSQLEEELLSG